MSSLQTMNNTQLTQEFEIRIDASPRFSMPLYPQSNGLVESLTRPWTLCFIIESQKTNNWHAKILFILWAYREVPNRTTGVEPFQLLYGQKPEGPLSILKSMWPWKLKGLQLDTTPVSSYLQKLKKQIEKVAEKAKVTSETAGENNPSPQSWIRRIFKQERQSSSWYLTQ